MNSTRVFQFNKRKEHQGARMAASTVWHKAYRTETVHQTFGNLQRSSCCAPLGARFTANTFMDIVMEDTVKTFDDFFRQDYKYLPYFKEIISYFLKSLTLRILLGQCKWQYSFFSFFHTKREKRKLLCCHADSH